jgi:hypothetical protein
MDASNAEHIMVRKRTDDGRGWYHEPPYTEEEELDFYRRVGGAKKLTILRGSPSPSRQSPQRPEEK